MQPVSKCRLSRSAGHASQALHCTQEHLCSGEGPLERAELIPLRHDLLVASVHCLRNRHGIQNLQRIPDLHVCMSISHDTSPAARCCRDILGSMPRTSIPYLLEPVVTVHCYQQIPGLHLWSFPLFAIVEAPEQCILWRTLQLQDTGSGSDVNCLLPAISTRSSAAAKSHRALGRKLL